MVRMQNLFAKRVLLLVAGTAGAQVIALAAAPLLTRLYTPGDFGLLAVFGGLLAIITLVASLRYELAIPIAENDKEAAHVVVLCLLITVMVATLSGLVFFFFGTDIADALKVAVLSNYFWLIPLGVVLTGMYQIFTHWAIRTKSFKAIAHTKWNQAVLMVGVQLAAYKLGAFALLLGQLAGQGGGAARLGASALRCREFRHIELGAVREAARRYRRFPIFSTWSGLMNTTSAQLPAVAFAAVFGATAAGLYLLTYRVLVAPTSLVGGAIGNVFFSHASDANRDRSLDSLVSSVYTKLIQLALGPTLLVVAAGPMLFEIVFGENWRAGGELARWMAPWILLSFIYSPLSTVFDVLERQGLEAALQSTLLVVRIAAIVIGASVGDMVFTIALYSLFSSAVYLLSLMVIARLSRNSLSSFVVPLLSSLGWGALMIMPIVVANVYSSSGPLWLAALVASAGMVAYHYKRLYQSVIGVQRVA